MHTTCSTITYELMFLEESVNFIKKVSKKLEILSRSSINNFVNGNEAKKSHVITMDALF